MYTQTHTHTHAHAHTHTPLKLHKVGVAKHVAVKLANDTEQKSEKLR